MTAIALTWSTVLGAAEPPTLTEAQVSALLTSVAGQPISQIWIRTRAVFHQYEGLDVTFIRRHWAHQKAVNNWSDANLAEKVREVCVIGFVYGNVTDNNFHKRSEAAQRSVNATIAECRLVQHVDNANKRTAVTVNRTMIAFATEAVAIADFLGRDFVEGPATRLLTALPQYMKTVVFPSVCPSFANTDVGELILKVFTIWSANMNLIINRRGPTRRKRNFTDIEFKDSYDAQYAYSEIAYGSNAFEGDRAKAFLINHDIGTAATFDNFKAVYLAEATRLSFPALTVTEAEWIAAWV